MVRGLHIATISAFSVALTVGGLARADGDSPGDKGAEKAKRVAVYPLVAPTPELRIYSRPIATAIADGLRKNLGVEVKVSADTGNAAKGIDLVIDGSIIVQKRGIALEARIRDPASGRKIGAVAARVRPLEDLESSAADLVKRLTPLASKWRRKGPSREPVRLKGSLLEVPIKAPGSSEGTPEKGGDEPPPLFVVARAGGNAAGGAVRVDADATEATYAFVERLGAAYAKSNATGSDEALALANTVRDSGAIYALALYLREVEFSYRGVLSARGSAVVRLIDRNGVVVMQKKVSTDTVVGSRGDRHTALIYSVAEQCLDIALPDLKKALAR